MPSPHSISPLSEFSSTTARSIRYVFSDLDDTITTNGALLPITYQALCSLAQKGLKLIIVTGSSAGWGECIARMWPVEAVIAEGGGVYFHKPVDGSTLITRHFVPQFERKNYALRLQDATQSVLQNFPRLTLSSDQFSRLYDLAIELQSIGPKEGPRGEQEIAQVLGFLHALGLNTKVSSIHINATFGEWDKLSSTQMFCQEVLAGSLEEILDTSIFIGDSLNDESMFGFFKYSVGVANVANYASKLAHLPQWITQLERGSGFAEFAQCLAP